MLAVDLFAQQITKQMSCSLSTITRFTAAQTAQKMQDVVDGRAVCVNSATSASIYQRILNTSV